MDSLHPHILKAVLITTTLILICFVYPVGFLFFSTLYLYRYLIEIFAKRIDRRFGPTVKGLDANFSAQTPYSNPTSVTLTRFYLDGSLDKAELISLLNERVIHHWDNQGNLVYSRLRKRIVSKFGYQFWFAVDNFNVSDHIRFLDDSAPNRVVRESEMMELVVKLCKLPFSEERSPWEIILVPNYLREDDPSIKSMMIVRLHHCLCDGYSLIKLWGRLSKKPPPPPSKNVPNSKDVTTGMKIRHWLRLLFEGSYETLHFILTKNVNENPWVQKAVKESEQKLVAAQTHPLSVPLLKKIVQKGGKEYNLACIMMTIFLQTAAKFMHQKRVILETPSKIMVTAPWPLPNHPDGFSNHFTVANMSISVDINDVRQTALNVSREFERMKESVLPEFSALMLDVIGMMPSKWIIKTNSSLRSTCIFSNFPGPFQPIDVCGKGIRELVGIASPGAPSAVASIAYAYFGRVRYTIGGDECNVTREDADFMTKTCEGVIKELEQLSNSLQSTKLNPII